MPNFTLLDSGERVDFTTGSVRDTDEGKPRYDLISPVGLKRVALLMAKGAEKYGERNWELGQPTSRFYASMFRHMMAWVDGERTEDHLAAVVFNAMGIMHMEEKVDEGLLSPDLIDFPDQEREAVLDKLVADAQEQDMGYE